MGGCREKHQAAKYILESRTRSCSILVRRNKTEREITLSLWFNFVILWVKRDKKM